MANPTWSLLFQDLPAVYARGELHSGPFVALALLQSAFLFLCVSTFLHGTVKEPAWPRLLSFLGLALGPPSVCILALWGFQAFTA